MKKNATIIAVAALAIIGGGIFIATQNSSDKDKDNSAQTALTENSSAAQSQKQTENTNTKKADTVDEDETDNDDSQTTSEGAYVDYSDDVISQNQGKTKLIFFHAGWCPSCLAIEKNVKSDTIPSDVVIIQADYDKETELKKRYGVTAQTTFVQVDDNGNLITRWIASPSDHIDDLIAKTN